MKTRKLVASTAILITGLGLLAPSVLAADPAPVPSKGTVKFIEGIIEKDLTIPEVVPEVVIVPPTDGAGFSQKDGLGILAPFLDFGEHAITLDAQTLKAKPMVYTEKADPSKKHYLPPMTVVKDLRGEVAGAWNVKVRATAFTTAGDAETLASTLWFSEAKLFNDTKVTAPSILPDPSNQEVSSDTTNFSFKAPFEFTSADKVLMSAKSGKGAGQTTYVPDATKYDGAAISQAIINSNNFYTADEEIAGVELRIPAGSKRTKAEYTSTLTWTLSDTADFN